MKSATKRTKIVATLGPSSNTREVIGALIDAGMNIARINFSHGTHDEHEKLFYIVKEEARKRDRIVGVLGDLCGPKIRVGQLGDGYNLVEGDFVTLYPEGEGTGGIGINQKAIIHDLIPGEKVLLNDGYFALEVTEKLNNSVKCRVLTGGLLTSKKGLNVPGIKINIPTITEKDIDDIYFGLDLGLDFFAVSFVQSASDILTAKSYARHIPVIAKIERPQAVKELDDIIKVCDGLMVARGDLGVEVGPEHVPVIQKLIIMKSRLHSKPVITATQMFESMITNPTPTRAEVSDVANSVLDGTDAVMLSAESANGKYPIESVSMLSRTLMDVEENPFFRIQKIFPEAGASTTDAIVSSTVSLPEALGIKLIVVFSQTGETARHFSRFRANIPVIALTSRLEVLARLALSWGVVPFYFEQEPSIESMLEKMNSLLLENHLVQKGDMIAVTFGYEGVEPGRTNTLKLHKIY
ncbi:pyruvate kinase [Myxococcota bacterium]|nr:pyruvate kinase [Myxococcota bacterium]MBU1379378.1 pyruvate kinase [Myxococcota bacterium]MBU1496780.1 pyruvate kinase [Myxococcota bacterium]